jgi:hypothetical protein
MDMDAEKLKNILDLHALFLIGDSKGRKADLTGANLIGAPSSIDNRDHVKSGEYENKLAHFAHIISESSTSMDPNIADIVHEKLWESI